ncbi:hypothetical protein BCR24_10060 [Enterococcus ureilyticus]|uniref:Uncharacterized protein n=1 Tax=Enterococcus ureilyticus TaxID=1131292 RepID=A0A1E5HG97_9ENTE|nr:hypothetical protein [Enterococcus ureilyticus]MBM7690471.1 hypothetical protein [Enterococcus ureilyticus]OEG23650.1 hypothetical protein BCR24_10060 [Enterococcus ureilyticus]
MDRSTQINSLFVLFNEEKKFIKDGYYRLRKLNENEIELAYLIAGSCGETIVHPQITVFLEDYQVVATKLIDMHTCPPLFLNRNTDNAQTLNKALDALIDKFVCAIKKNTKAT